MVKALVSADRRRPRPPGPRNAPETDEADEAGEAIVRARGLTKVYGDNETATKALDEADLDVKEGELVAVMGASGSGKSTLLNCLAGLEPPTRGTVWIDTQDLWALGENERTGLRGREMGFVFQSFNLLPVLSAQENVELPLLINGTRPREARRQAQQMLRRVGLEQRAAHTPTKLSGGEQQRVALARALVHRPRLMWADEPTGNLDAETSRVVMDLLVRLNKELGTTIVLVTHDPSVAQRAGRILQMVSGRFTKQRPPAARTLQKNTKTPGRKKTGKRPARKTGG